MFKIMSSREAIGLIKDGDTICINCFITLGNPEELHRALAESFFETGKPNNLSLFCSAGFGGWSTSIYAEPYIAAGAVKKVIGGHFSSMPAALKLLKENKIEAYNMPLGVMSHMQRAAAGGKPGVISKVGLNLFVDPRIEGPGMNQISKDEWVKVIELEGEEYLFYRAPKFDIAFIRGTYADANGNISFDKECITADALSVAQATKANGGKVIVQVAGLNHKFARPRNVIVPGTLVDVVVVCEEQRQIIKSDEYFPTLSGEIHVPYTHMDYWAKKLKLSGERGEKESNLSHSIIGSRAAMELTPGDVVNIGIGVPENVATAASKLGMLSTLTMTVESGCIGGLPAPGIAFGAAIGADVITDISQQFDYYDGGGLDICFMGGFEVDKEGNVNAHSIPPKIAGIGGFANITYATPNVVFCVNFTTRGLKVAYDGSKLSIENEGSVVKFVDKVASISFSAKNALKKGQNVLYVTERCVFKLYEDGLTLIEVAPGIDVNVDILDKLDFPVNVSKDLKVMNFSLS